MIDSLMLFLQHNPAAIFAFVFAIALCESLAVVGIIVPGVGLITAASIMAGNLQLSVYGLVLSAVLGAFIGDVISFYIGRWCEPYLANAWPFKQHPQWLENGQRFFKHHGGKSIFFGRFVGPIRPFIPMAAGMLRMEPKHFMWLNGLSAVAWGILYILPSYLLGEAISIQWLFSWQGLLALALVSVLAVIVSLVLKRSSKPHSQ